MERIGVGVGGRLGLGSGLGLGVGLGRGCTRRATLLEAASRGTLSGTARTPPTVLYATWPRLG